MYCRVIWTHRLGVLRVCYRRHHPLRLRRQDHQGLGPNDVGVSKDLRRTRTVRLLLSFSILFVHKSGLCSFFFYYIVLIEEFRYVMSIKVRGNMLYSGSWDKVPFFLPFSLFSLLILFSYPLLHLLLLYYYVFYRSFSSSLLLDISVRI